MPLSAFQDKIRDALVVEVGDTKSHRLPMSVSLETPTPPLAANCAVCAAFRFRDWPPFS
jgi:hypothetical protein